MKLLLSSSSSLLEIIDYCLIWRRVLRKEKFSQSAIARYIVAFRTMKWELEKISHITENAEEIYVCHEVSWEQRPCLEGPNASRSYKLTCTFVKRKQQKRAISILTNCVDLGTSVTIRKAIIATGDSRIIGLSSLYFFAADARYVAGPVLYLRGAIQKLLYSCLGQGISVDYATFIYIKKES